MIGIVYISLVIGFPKAKCAAEFVMKRVPGCQIKWYQTKIQDFGASFYINDPELLNKFIIIEKRALNILTKELKNIV